MRRAFICVFKIAIRGFLATEEDRINSLYNEIAGKLFVIRYKERIRYTRKIFHEFRVMFVIARDSL